MKARTDGEGSVFRDGGTWLAQVYVKDRATGQQSRWGDAEDEASRLRRAA